MNIHNYCVSTYDYTNANRNEVAGRTRALMVMEGKRYSGGRPQSTASMCAEKYDVTNCDRTEPWHARAGEL